MKNKTDLMGLLQSIDRVSIHIPMKATGFPLSYIGDSHKKLCLEDHLVRLFGKAMRSYQFQAKGSGKSGLLSISSCGQQVLERTACQITKEMLILRFEVGFPANGRSINAKELTKVLFHFVPDCVRSSLFYANINQRQLTKAIELTENQWYIRNTLDSLGLCSFVANGSILPRLSGVSDLPSKQATAFVSPASMEVTFNLPYGGAITGMGIPNGITLFVGGGYHGKSTILRALELGVYNHIAGDGREYVITRNNAVKLRAEDGRVVQQVDISTFINHLPSKLDTTNFQTDNASGSTSQAANLMEAIESGSNLLLIDEDTSATNFMIRDELMQEVICKEEEPITPYIERVRSLYEDWGISSILVAGSSGAYFHLADTIIQMKDYIPVDITKHAKEIASRYQPVHTSSCGTRPMFKRCPAPSSSIKKVDRLKMKFHGTDGFSVGYSQVELRYVEQLVDGEQSTALAYLLTYAHRNLLDGKKTMIEIVDELELLLKKKGLAGVCDSSYVTANMAMPRRYEMFAGLNRYRG